MGRFPSSLAYQSATSVVFPQPAGALTTVSCPGGATVRRATSAGRGTCARRPAGGWSFVVRTIGPGCPAPVPGPVRAGARSRPRAIARMTLIRFLGGRPPPPPPARERDPDEEGPPLEKLR